MRHAAAVFEGGAAGKTAHLARVGRGIEKFCCGQRHLQRRLLRNHSSIEAGPGRNFDREPKNTGFGAPSTSMNRAHRHDGRCLHQWHWQPSFDDSSVFAPVLANRLICVDRPGSIGCKAKSVTTPLTDFRIAGPKLLAGIIICWNTVHMGRAVAERRNEGT